MVSKPKIVRAYDGALASACGAADDIYLFQEWFKGETAPFSDQPAYRNKGDEGIGILLLRRDGTTWRSDEGGAWNPVNNLYALGHSDAVNFTVGAMLAGASAEQAVLLCVACIQYTAAPVQVERL